MTQTKQRMLGWNGVYQQRCFRFSWLLFIGLAWVEMVGAQEPPANSQAHPPPAQQVLEEKTSKSLVAPCVEPPPLVSLKDYNGPLKKAVGIFARALERKSIQPPHYKPGVVLCSLELKDKFVLFVQDSLDPVLAFRRVWNKVRTEIQRSGKAPRAMASASRRTSQIRHRQNSSRTLHIRRSFPKTRGITGWRTAA